MLYSLVGGDTAVFCATHTSYSLARQRGDYGLNGKAGTAAAGDGQNLPSGIERVMFADGHVARDPSGGGNAELVVRLIGSIYSAQLSPMPNTAVSVCGLWTAGPTISAA